MNKCVLGEYTASAVANTTSRSFLNGFPMPLFLTTTQFLTAFLFLGVFLQVKGEIPAQPQNKKLNKLLLKLSFVYTLGFLFVNSGYLLVNVSLAETLRSTEPLISVFLAKFYLSEAKINNLIIFSMIPIAVGGALSSAGDSSFSLIALLCVMISNMSFSLRSLITKQVKAHQKNMNLVYPDKTHFEYNAFQLFYLVSKIGLVSLLFVMMLKEVLSILTGFNELSVSEDIVDINPDDVRLIITNGVAYFLYNQMSFYVLSKVSLVSHAVANAFRRVVTIIFSVWYFGNYINQINALGITLAIVGVLLYSYAKETTR
eukprot:maker-scaffold_58-snap-gene-0.25-mRNA-1 protein AED:0.06 eAED:0.08 QI:0/0.5/0.66/1/1/1/3/64/314